MSLINQKVIKTKIIFNSNQVISFYKNLIELMINAEVITFLQMQDKLTSQFRSINKKHIELKILKTACLCQITKVKQIQSTRKTPINQELAEFIF